MPKIKELILQAGGAAEESVTAAKGRYLDQVRGVLRDLTRLKFTDRQGVESAAVGKLGCAFLAMAVPVCDLFPVDRPVLNREMGRDAVGQVILNAIAAVLIQTRVGARTIGRFLLPRSCSRP